YLYIVYLEHGRKLGDVAFELMGDGITFMLLSACFFVISRSLSPEHWERFYISLLLLLAVDSIWIAAALHRSVPLVPWQILNGFLGGFLIVALFFFRYQKKPRCPPAACAVATLVSTSASYYLMWQFYFP